MADTLKPSEVLAKAADLIEPEGAWTQVVLAQDAAKNEVSPLDPDAVCWCAAGAIARVRQDAENPYDNPVALTLKRTLPRAYRKQDIWEWNDDRARNRRNQLRIVAALRKAAELARSEGQ